MLATLTYGAGALKIKAWKLIIRFIEQYIETYGSEEERRLLNKQAVTRLFYGEDATQANRYGYYHTMFNDQLGALLNLLGITPTLQHLKRRCFMSAFYEPGFGDDWIDMTKVRRLSTLLSLDQFVLCTPRKRHFLVHGNHQHLRQYFKQCYSEETSPASHEMLADISTGIYTPNSTLPNVCQLKGDNAISPKSLEILPSDLYCFLVELSLM